MTEETIEITEFDPIWNIPIADILELQHNLAMARLNEPGPEEGWQTRVYDFERGYVFKKTSITTHKGEVAQRTLTKYPIHPSSVIPFLVAGKAAERNDPMFAGVNLETDRFIIGPARQTEEFPKGETEGLVDIWILEAENKEP